MSRMTEKEGVRIVEKEGEQNRSGGGEAHRR
jgi:hypothetical protein